MTTHGHQTTPPARASSHLVWLYWRLPNGRTGRLGPLTDSSSPPRAGERGPVFWRVPLAR